MLDNVINGIKEREWKISIPVLKVYKWIGDRKRPKQKTHYEWIYDGCGCKPLEGYRSEPYCKKHYNKLIRVEIPDET